MSPTEDCIIDSSSLQHAPGNDDTSFPFYKLETGKRKYQQRRLKPQTEFKEKLQTEIVDRKRKKFVGVRQRSSGRWVAEIKDTTQKIRLWLGTFDTPEDAAKAYDEAACLLRGMNTRTNFLRPSASSPSVLPSKTAQMLLQRLQSSPGTSSSNKTQAPDSVADALVQQYLEEHPAGSSDVGSTSVENALSSPVADDPGKRSEHCSHEHRVQIHDQMPESACTSLFDICDEILLPLDSPLRVDDFLETVADDKRQTSVLEEEEEHPIPLFDVHELLLDPNSHCLPNPAYLKATIKCKFLESTDSWVSRSLSTTHTTSEYPSLEFSPVSAGLVQAKKRTSPCNL